MEPWLRHETLNGVSDPLVGTPIGANGIVHVNGALYVGNTTKKTVVRVPILADGRPGAPTVVKQFEGELDFVDGITADVHGNLYPLMIGRYALVRLNPHTGDVTTLATTQDGLHLPASAAFGTAHGNRKAVYVTNFAFADPLGVGSGPAVVRVEVGIPGRTLTGAGGQ